MLYRDYLKSKYQNTAVKLANAEGVPCVLEYSKGKNVRNYEVYGNSVQDGTPSPEIPVEIQSVGDLVTDTESEYYGKYDIPITVTGTRSETTHIYLDEPLRKVGDYADYIDFKNQKVIRKVKHREFSSNNNWSVYSSAANHFQTIVGDNYFAQVEGVKAMSNYYPQYSGKYYSITSLDYAVLSVDGSRLRFRDIRYTTLDEWKTFLDTLETPLAVNYILATPTEETISLPALKTFKGTNVISVDTTVLPSNIKANYVRT